MESNFLPTELNLNVAEQLNLHSLLQYCSASKEYEDFCEQNIWLQRTYKLPQFKEDKMPVAPRETDGNKPSVSNKAYYFLAVALFDVDPEISQRFVTSDYAAFNAIKLDREDLYEKFIKDRYTGEMLLFRYRRWNWKAMRAQSKITSSDVQEFYNAPITDQDMEIFKSKERIDEAEKSYVYTDVIAKNIEKYPGYLELYDSIDKAPPVYRATYYASRGQIELALDISLGLSTKTAQSSEKTHQLRETKAKIDVIKQASLLGILRCEDTERLLKPLEQKLESLTREISRIQLRLKLLSEYVLLFPTEFYSLAIKRQVLNPEDFFEILDLYNVWYMLNEPVIHKFYSDNITSSSYKWKSPLAKKMAKVFGQ